jgi:hypothetical protein
LKNPFKNKQIMNDNATSEAILKEIELNTRQLIKKQERSWQLGYYGQNLPIGITFKPMLY